MAFNAGTYRANRWARKAKAELAAARDIKARAAAGEAYDWEIRRIPLLVRSARISNQLALSQRRINAITKSIKSI